MSEPTRERNPYAPPSTQVGDPRQYLGALSPAPPFFAVSVTKFIVMTVATLGFYELYWFYRNWKLIKERDGTTIMPVWRAIFSIFFIRALFTQVRDFKHAANNDAKQLPAGPLAWGWIILTLMAWLPDLWGYLLPELAFLFVVPVQMRVNLINAAVAPDHDPNSQFTALNWLGVVLGGVLLALGAVIVALLPTVDL